jgi:hypothetical protein
MFRRFAPALAVAAVLVAVPASASADPGIGEPTSFTAAFTTKHPGKSTGLQLRTTGVPPVAPTTLAPVVRQTNALPRGTRLDLGALPQCEADAATLAALGAEAACPAHTRVGTGRAEGLANGVAVAFDLTVYAIDGRLFFAGSRAGVSLKTGFYGDARGRRLVLTVPTAGGTIAPTLFEADLAAAMRGNAAWLRTPAHCPHGGYWTAEGTFQGLTAVDGAPVGEPRTLVDELRCRRG